MQGGDDAGQRNDGMTPLGWCAQGVRRVGETRSPMSRPCVAAAADLQSDGVVHNRHLLSRRPLWARSTAARMRCAGSARRRQPANEPRSWHRRPTQSSAAEALRCWATVAASVPPSIPGSSSGARVLRRQQRVTRPSPLPTIRPAESASLSSGHVAFQDGDVSQPRCLSLSGVEARLLRIPHYSA